MESHKHLVTGSVNAPSPTLMEDQTENRLWPTDSTLHQNLSLTRYTSKIYTYDIWYDGSLTSTAIFHIQWRYSSFSLLIYAMEAFWHSDSNIFNIRPTSRHWKLRLCVHRHRRSLNSYVVTTAIQYTAYIKNCTTIQHFLTSSCAITHSPGEI